MDDLWERFSGWLVAAFIAVSSAFLALWQRREAKEMQDILDAQKDLQKRIHDNKNLLANHETRLQVADVHINGLKSDLTAIKVSITNLHSRVSEGDKGLADKLDRLLERQHGV